MLYWVSQKEVLLFELIFYAKLTLIERGNFNLNFCVLFIKFEQFVEEILKLSFQVSEFVILHQETKEFDFSSLLKKCEFKDYFDDIKIASQSQNLQTSFVSVYLGIGNHMLKLNIIVFQYILSTKFRLII